MTLSLKLAAERPTVLFQQGCGFEVQLTNEGRQPVDVDLPPLDPRYPIVRVLDLRTGVEHETRRELPAGRPAEAESVPGGLEPSQTARSTFELSEYLPAAEPGRYEVTAVWEWGDGQRVESNTVAVEILPTTPRADAWVSLVPGHDDERWGVWVDVAGDEPRAVRSRVVLGAGGGLVEALPLWPCPLRARPLLSCSFPDEPASEHWVAWLDRGDLHYGFVDDVGGVSKLRKVPVPRDDAVLAGPLHIEDQAAAGEPPAGVALLAMGPPGGSEFGLQAIQLGRKAEPGSVAAAAGPRPSHLWSHALGGKQRWLAMLQQARGRVALLTTPWPGLRRAQVDVQQQAEWEGRLLGAGTQVLQTGVAAGAALLHTQRDGRNHLELVAWTLSGDGRCEVQEAVELAWEWQREVAAARVALRHDGRPGALLRDKPDGQWWCWDGQNDPAPVAGEWCRSDLPLDLAFLGGCAEPLLVGARFEHGWGVMHADGRPLPARVK